MRIDLAPTYEDGPEYEDGGYRREVEESDGVRGYVELADVEEEEVLATVEYEAMEEDRS